MCDEVLRARKRDSSLSTHHHIARRLESPLMAIIGIDFGAKRIGVATSDSGEIATPHSVLRNESDVIAKLAALGEQLGGELFAVGVARDEPRLRDFAERLRHKTCQKVVRLH